MLDFYFSELRRFRNSAAIYAVATLVLLTMIGQLIDLPGANYHLQLLLLPPVALSGTVLAVVQFGSYRQPSRWIWLLHRPLHRGRILAAIGLASSTLIALALVLPLFIVLLAQARFSDRVVDLRHYAGAVFLGLTALSAWLAGGYMILHRSRWAFVMLVLPYVLTLHMASWPVVLALSLACNALLAGLVYTVFRPNRIALGDAVTTVASALPLQAGFYLALLWGGSTLFQMGQMVAGVHPFVGSHPPPGGYIEVMRARPHDALLAGIANTGDPRAPAWRAARGADNMARLYLSVRQLAVPGLMTNLGTVQFRDGREGMWTFSHDRMLYKGQNERTQAPLGWFGAGGHGDSTPFDSQPEVQNLRDGRVYLMTAHDLYTLEMNATRLRHLLHLDGSEQLGSGVAAVGRHTVVLTNRRLLILGPGAAPGMQTSVQASLPLPLPFGDLGRIDLAQVADGVLVSFTSGNRQLEGVMDARQLTYLVDPAGHALEVAQRTLAHDFPPLFEHKDWWLSPALQALVNLPDMLLDEGVVPDAGAGRFAPLLRPRPVQAWAAALALALLAGAGAAWWTRRARMTPRARVAWCLACLLLGVPALLSLMVLRPRARSVPARALTAAPVPAPAGR